MYTIHEEYSVDLLIEGGGIPAFWYCLGYSKQYIKTNTPKLITGYSAGSIVAVLLLPELNILDIIETYINYINCCNIFSLEYCIRNMMNDILPENTYTLANGRIGIILCEPRNNNKCKMVIHWNNNEELIDCLISSCYNPYIMNGSCSHTDNKYDCRDAIHGDDLQKFTNNFPMVISKPHEYNGFFEFIDKFLPLSTEKAITLFEQGVNDFLNSTNSKKN